MTERYENKKEPCQVVEVLAEDTPKVNSIKRIIRDMTQYHEGDRKRLLEVREELTGK